MNSFVLMSLVEQDQMMPLFRFGQRVHERPKMSISGAQFKAAQEMKMYPLRMTFSQGEACGPCYYPYYY